jgi:hypothetical protein
MSIKQHRTLEADLQKTDQAMSYNGSTMKGTKVEVRNNPLAKASSTFADKEAVPRDWPKRDNGAPDFERMTSAQRLAYD